MGKRDIGSFVVIALFGASLAATSKPKPDEDEAPRTKPRGDAAVAVADAGTTKTAEVDAAVAPTVLSPEKNAELPDTTAWKTFSYPAAKLTAKMPPESEVTCTKAADHTTCVLSQYKKTLAVFASGGLSSEAMIDTLKRDASMPSKAIFEDGKDYAVMRNDAQHGSWCEMVATSPAGLAAVYTSQVQANGSHGASLNRNECLIAIAFGRTLAKTP